jgi:hypothetical protein
MGYMVRVGDRDDYHDEGMDMDEVAERLRMSRVKGPLLPYVCSSRYASEEMRGKVVGFEAEGCCGDQGYISLYVATVDTVDYERSLTEEEIADLNSRLPKIKDDYPDGECPDCFEPIPDDVWKGDACENCGHVFTGDVMVDD